MADNSLEIARAAFGRRDWSTARAEFERSRAGRPLAIDDLRALRRAAWWLGDTVASMALAEEVHRRLLAEGAPAEAAVEALDLTLEWVDCGYEQVAAGWLNRARRDLEGQPPCTAHGYLIYAEAMLDLQMSGRTERAAAAVPELGAMADAQADPVLMCFVRTLAGITAIQQGRTVEGFGDLDEAMLPVLAGEVPPLWGGDIFCTVIHVCEFLADFTRMRAWTDSLARWASDLSATFLYAGVTRVHQLQLESAEGRWDVVEREAGDHSELLAGSHSWVAGTGYQELGEVRRLRGDLAGAESAFKRARELGIDPQPGAALLCAVRRGPRPALEELRVSLGERGPLDRTRLIPAAVQLAVELGEIEYAELLAAELYATATTHQAPGLLARWHYVAGRLAVAAGRWSSAVEHLDEAAGTLREQRCRYAIAQVHELLAVARLGLGSPQTAAADEATALAIYRQLGAVPDVERLAGHAAHPGGLTERETEVLGHIAAGASNREVAATLGISEKTVGRHVANIFLKLAVSSRTAAAAWARDNGVPRRTHT